MYILKVYSIQHKCQNETQMPKKIPSDKMNGAENALFFVSRPRIHHRFTFDLRLLYELKHKVCLSKAVCGFSILNSISFLLKFIFLFNKIHGLFDFKTS